jgi:hypothetical protein
MHSRQHFSSECKAETIYDAVKKQDREPLENLSVTDDVIAVLSQLIKENDKASIIFLIKINSSFAACTAYCVARNDDENNLKEWLGLINRDYPEQLVASFDMVAYGLAISGQIEKFYSFCETVKLAHPEKILDVLDKMAEGLAQRKDIPTIFFFIKTLSELQKISVMKIFARDLAHDRATQHAFLEEMMANYPAFIEHILTTIADVEAQNQTCIDEAMCLKSLAMIDDLQARTRVVDELKHSTPFATPHLLKKATKLNTVMREQFIGYPEALGWIDPHTQIFLLATLNLQKKDKAISIGILAITHYLSPMPLDKYFNLAENFYKKISRARLFKLPIHLQPNPPKNLHFCESDQKKSTRKTK